MKKKIYWKALINKMGKGKIIKLIIAIIIAIIGMIGVFYRFGIELVIESFALSYLFDTLRDFWHEIKETKEEITV